MGVFCFVILHYGNHTVTQRWVDSILNLKHNSNIHIVIVDNDCEKNDDDRLLSKGEYKNKDNIDIITVKEKMGFSLANNKGYEFAREHIEPEVIIMANNDITFEQEDFIERIQKFKDNNSFHILSPDIIDNNTGMHQSPIAVAGRTNAQLNYTIVMNYICLFMLPVIYPVLKSNEERNKKNISQLTNNYSTDIHDHIVPCGACIIVSSDFIKNEKKMFWPETNFYYEEYILYERCKNNNYTIIYNPDIKVIHGDGVSTKSTSKNDKARLRFIMKNTYESARIYKKYKNVSSNNC